MNESIVRQVEPECARCGKPIVLCECKRTANDVQVGGDHYKRLAIQTWDFIASNDLDFFQGNIIKYVTRWKTKGGVEDLRKARHYLDKYIELNSTPDPTTGTRKHK